MERQIRMEEVSDGKKYTANDMVKLGCNDCEGCSACCQGMGSSILLDPYDICQLTSNMGIDFMKLLEKHIDLNIVDGLILPNIRLEGEREACTFLNSEGRCSIHAFRPGMCRLFPLGRIYEENSFSYFLQVHECHKQNRTKVKIKKWLDIPNLIQYEQYIIRWHYFLKRVSERMRTEQDLDRKKQTTMYLLQLFFQRAYSEQDFYRQIEERIIEAELQIFTSSLNGGER